MISLPFLKKKNKPEEKHDVFIGIFFKEQDGVVMYLEDGHAGLKILGTEYFNYSNGWEQLVDDIDEVLYRLETKTHLAPQQAIFFIYSHFVDPQHREIKRPFLSKIKELAKSLDLKPLGYIECQEAIIEHFKAREHAPLHMILLEFDRTVVTITLYQGGNNIHQETLARSGNVIDTLTPVFQSLKQHYVLPNRLIMYDEKSLTNDVSTLLSNRWSEEIFPTAPKIDILTQEDLHKSLVDVFARQIHHTDEMQVATPSVTATAAPSEVLETMEEGFTFSEVSSIVPEESNIRETPNQVMGFMIGDDDDQQTTAQASPPTPAKKAKGVVPKIRMPKISVPSIGHMLPIVAVVVVALVLVGLGATEYFLHKAQVQVTFPAKQIDKDVTIGSDLKLDEGTDLRKVDGTAQTTGQKQVGEKAKGTVTIYNSSLSESQTLAKGTKLTGPNNLSFVLETDVKVASASGDASDIRSSTAKVTAIAGDIGTEYNIGSGTKLNIQGESSSTVIAKTENAFSGGSKKQIRVASTTDINKLRASVMEQAKKETAANLRAKIGSGKVIVEDLTDVSLDGEKLSKKAGDEAESISLTADAKTTYYTYDENALKAAFTKELSHGLAGGTRVQAETVAYRIVRIDKKDDPEARAVTFKVTSKAVPVFDRSQLVSRMSGKAVSALDKIVKDGFHATGIRVVTTPNLPVLNMYTPIMKKNVTVEVEYQ
ncbi:hypothetical protein HYS00_04610 [Candidatus Microgenomates bacterium]|nr:hypothetical protein [Candidatus Microgenomates bacterium]